MPGVPVVARGRATGGRVFATRPRRGGTGGSQRIGRSGETGTVRRVSPVRAVAPSSLDVRIVERYPGLGRIGGYGVEMRRRLADGGDCMPRTIVPAGIG